jgi:hypothetical protein
MVRAYSDFSLVRTCDREDDGECVRAQISQLVVIPVRL